ncbi:hypothetical protein [Dongia sp.]|uniref:hypothetical protein n=1 Tax=Dongia sp. TaxID=1977262 RepID=UPI0035ADC1F3
MTAMRLIIVAATFLVACSQTPQQPKSCGATAAEKWFAMTEADLMGNPDFQEFAAGIEAGQLKSGASSMAFVAAVANLATAETALADNEPGRACLLIKQVRLDPRLPIQFRPIQ